MSEIADKKLFRSILVVEDDEAIRSTLASVLETEGYRALTAENGRQALEILRAGGCEAPCLILLDLMMPEMNGWEFLEIRRKADVIASIPVIVISAATDQMIAGVRRAVLPGQAVKVLKKPLELDMLLNELREYCGSDLKRRMVETAEAVSEPIQEPPGVLKRPA